MYVSMNVEELKNILNSKKITPEQRGVLIQSGRELGLTPPSCKCRDKWYDFGVEIYHTLLKKKLEPVEQVEQVEPKYIYKKKITTVTPTGRYGQDTPVGSIEKLKQDNLHLFLTLYKENLNWNENSK